MNASLMLEELGLLPLIGLLTNIGAPMLFNASAESPLTGENLPFQRQRLRQSLITDVLIIFSLWLQGMLDAS